MKTGTVVINALKSVGKWVVENPSLVIDTADKIIKLKPEDKVNQLGTAVLELDRKINSEMILVHKQLRTMKIIISVMSAALAITVIAVILLAIK